MSHEYAELSESSRVIPLHLREFNFHPLAASCWCSAESWWAASAPDSAALSLFVCLVMDSFNISNHGGKSCSLRESQQVKLS